jgi:hypothetical protein
VKLEDLVGPDEEVCGDSVVARLMGGRPEAVPDRYAIVSPANYIPLGVPQRLIIGEFDLPGLLQGLEGYADSARQAGDDVALEVINNASHHEVVAPGSSAWLSVRSAVLSLLGIEKK